MITNALEIEDWKLLSLTNSMCSRLPPQRGNTMSAKAIGLGQRHPQIIQPRRGGTNFHPTRVAPLGLSGVCVTVTQAVGLG